MQMFIPMIEKLLKSGNNLSEEQAKTIIKKEIELTCKSILEDTAVFKNDAVGQNALKEFLLKSGLKQNL